MTNTREEVAVAEAIGNALWDGFKVPSQGIKEAAIAAIEAYEMASVKEMTVDEVAEVIRIADRAVCPFTCKQTSPCEHCNDADEAAKSLAKLGTIRITGGGE